jgi:DnaK suppressor protein
MARRKKRKKKKKGQVKFPQNLLKPVGSFLQARLKSLEKRKKEIDTEDPFKNEERVIDNASPDTDAAEQFGHARTSALKDSLDKKIVQTRKALTKVKVGSYGICEDCGEMIDTDRLVAYPEATLCAKCQAKRES